ncbi:MotA/TolQ/ExbB proton channel family protein [Cupriavidus ulmosensis]|uniref:MotA/TolQ/ExbB proton channel family protein n=1 Tax=Cupriavidus ulmosensis TaxID=3065913 RepID=UPI00296A9690|nr:MotA/TolQ/ExbB proton channel family protein [Cupriavidus sp. CV2]MDW3683832.1 MotA/TolQ/ExbB proton channel family protein [Cupriavidus sp. CV2]
MHNLTKLITDSYGLLPLLAIILLIATTIIVERLSFFSKCVSRAENLRYELQRVERGNIVDIQKIAKQYDGTIQAAVVRSGIKNHGNSEAEFVREIENSIMFEMPKLDRNLWILDTAVTLGPLVGLFGTIAGMISSFNVLGASGTSNPLAVSGGIANALIATGFGLTIAIVGLVFLNYFNKQVRNVLLQMDLIQSMLAIRLAGTPHIEARLSAVGHH